MPAAKQQQIGKSVLDAHVGEIIGIEGPTMADIRAYQDARIAETFRYAKQHSRFYAQLYADVPALAGCMDLERLPLIRDIDLRNHGPQMLCVPQEKIDRIYTLDTGGSTGAPKRLFFTAAEIEQTVQFFHAGIPMFMAPGDRALVLLPCARENSVGRIFGESVRRLGAAPVYFGLPGDTGEVYQLLKQSNINVVLAAPQSMLSLLKIHDGAIQLKTVLLSTDYLDPADKRALAEGFGCVVYEHYGMTEMCFGGGVDCPAFAGYHLREADFFTEIVDGQGCRLPDGQWGELVLTTLRREAMPLIRYATGDISRFIPQPCPCGSILPLLDRIQKRQVNKSYNASYSD